jgi:hypothetical protein
MKMRKAQSVLEYAVILTVIVAGLAAMQIYMKRAAEGKLRESADRIGEQFSAAATTYKRVSSQAADYETEESFGLDPAYVSKAAQGVSYFVVKTPTPVVTTMKDATNESASEKVTKGFDSENLF